MGLWVYAFLVALCLFEALIIVALVRTCQHLEREQHKAVDLCGEMVVAMQKARELL